MIGCDGLSPQTNVRLDKEPLIDVWRRLRPRLQPPFQVKYSAADKSKWDVVVPDEVGGPIATKFEVNFGYTFDP
jgi:hypothetical protein